MAEDIRPANAGDSIRERICQYFVAQLNAVDRPDGLLVDRQRSLPLHASLLPAALVYLQKEDSERIGDQATVTKRTVILRVEVRALHEPSDQLLDPIINWVIQQLMSDFTVGGLADGIEELGTQWIQEAGKEVVIGAAAIDFEVTYRTVVNDLIGAP